MNLNNKPVIIPAAVETPNGDYAVLMWVDGVIPRIATAIKKGQSLCHYIATGFATTPYGNLAWLKCCLDTLDNFQNATRSNLFWFDLTITPSEYDESWLKTLQQQQQLELVIAGINQTARLTKLLGRQQLEGYLIAIEQVRKSWSSDFNHTLAVTYLRTEVLKQVEVEGTKKIVAKYATKYSEIEILNRCAFDAAARLGITLTERDFTKETEFVLSKSKHELAKFLSSSSDLRINLIKDWLFASLCLKHSLSSKKPKFQIAIGVTETGNWVWQYIPYENLIEILYSLSCTYRYLLQHNWKKILASEDVLATSINLTTIADLGKVPTREAFNYIDSILKTAIVERCFGIDTHTTILVGKPGLQEIEFLPIAGSGAKCLFVVRLDYDQSKRVNLCIVGEIDAAAGIIRAVGIKENTIVRLLLFCVAIAYRDILVAREVVAEPSQDQRPYKGKIRAKDGSSPIRLVARVKRASLQIDSNFATPEKLVSALQRYSSYIRSCHLRRLGEKMKASETQLQLAEAYQFFIPPGYTFVRPATVGDPSNLRKEFKSISLMNLLFSG